MQHEYIIKLDSDLDNKLTDEWDIWLGEEDRSPIKWVEWLTLMIPYAIKILYVESEDGIQSGSESDYTVIIFPSEMHKTWFLLNHS